MTLFKYIDIKSLGDDRGDLVSLEANKNIPFSIQRIYYIFDTEQDVSRGFHAHKKLKQVAFCIKGQCEMILDNGSERETALLNSPNKGVLIEQMLWREMHNFSHDCILMVVASEHYDEDDYIRDYEHFINKVNLDKG
jgi:dTDP-4-dehydrorhamnose 3,5-epimerase-like enzyme